MNRIGARNRALYIGSITIINIAILMIVIIAYLAFASVKVIAPNIQPYRVITKEVKVGDILIYEVDSCKYKSVPATVTRRFVDEQSTRYPQPTEVSNIKEGCSVIRVPVAIPQLHSGIWYMELEISYQVNPLRTENYHFTTEKFNIIDDTL